MAISAHSPDPGTRRRIALSAAATLRGRSDDLSRLQALVGFDGFVDHILDPVRQRRSMATDDYQPIATITEFAQRIQAAAGVSTNIELVRRESRFGGNGPLLASGLIGLGMPTTFVGCIGHPDAPTAPPSAVAPATHPLFDDFARRCHRAIPLGPPGHTDALEFADGKVMFNQTASVQQATWNAVLDAVGLDPLRSLVRQSTLIGMVNWSLCGGVESIWEGLIRDILPVVVAQGTGSSRRAFIDLSDPAKRTDEDVRRAMRLLARMNAFLPVTLGLNLSEARRIARVLDVEHHQPDTTAPADIAETALLLAGGIRAAIGVDGVVIHPREGAAGATADGQAQWFTGPVVRSPRLSTGAGDHFNAGFAIAQAASLPLAQCLATGTATSGCYVRDGASPSLARVVDMLQELPEPEFD